jgi:DNA invertase Pin-like site-specific DNA recombinase
MRVGIYARVSTSDKDQEPETQLIPLREFVHAQGWEPAREWVDRASATDLKGRTAWRGLLDAASKRKVDLIVVWKLDRAFRSVLHASQTREDFRRWRVGLRSYTEPWADTTSPQGELVFNLLATFAQFERSLIRERVKAGMARAKKQGKTFGRPTKINGEWETLRPLVESKQVSQVEAARRLGCARSTVQRMLGAGKGGENRASESREN